MKRTAIMYLLLPMALIPAIASATLGEDASTIERDRAELRAQRSVTQAASYSVHELQLPGGTVVREYLTNSSQVFAITWKGPSIPDMQQLLGAYSARMVAAGKATGSLRRPVMVHDSDLVIRTGGHTRAFFGTAYLPQRLPAGLTVDQLR